MADPISERFAEKEKKVKLQRLSQKARSAEDVAEEEAVIKKAKEERAKSPDKYQLHASAAAGRNDPCPCGSGRKYKKCCGSKEA